MAGLTMTKVIIKMHKNGGCAGSVFGRVRQEARRVADSDAPGFYAGKEKAQIWRQTWKASFTASQMEAGFLASPTI